MEIPDVKYARSGDVAIAYQVVVVVLLDGGGHASSLPRTAGV